MTPKDINKLSGIILYDTPEKITQKGYESCSTTLLPINSILFSSRAPIGLVAITGREMATNQGFKSLIPGEQVDPYFLFWTMRQNARVIDAKASGTTFKEVSKADIEAFEIPLPPLEIQRRIAAILNRADAIRRKRQEAIALTEQLLRSTFLEMFGDPVTNPKGWPRHLLGDLIKVKSGSFLPSKELDQTGQYPVYGGNGVSGWHCKYLFESPQIVIGRVGVYCGAVHQTPPKSWITDNALYVSTSSPSLVEDYLLWALKMCNLNQYANQAAQPLVTGTIISKVPLLVPDHATQMRFSKFYQRHAATLSLAKQAQQEADNLFNSLVQRAFTGQL